MVSALCFILLAPLFALSAFFSSSETVLFSLTPLAVKKLGAKKPAIARRIEEWKAEPSKVLSAILAGNTLVNFAIASIGYIALRGVAPSWAEVLSIPLWTILLLFLGEIGPKQYALRHAEALAPVCVRTLVAVMPIMRPFSALMVAGSMVFKDLLSRERRALTDDELSAVIESAAQTGVLDREEASMVKGVMRLPDLYAMNEMTPRVRMQGVRAEWTSEEQLAAARELDFPFVPVYRGDMDHVEAFLNVAKKTTEPPLCVSEHDGLDDILVLFMKTGRRIALVKDRWGGTAGLITRGDILELIVKPVEEDEE